MSNTPNFFNNFTSQVNELIAQADELQAKLAEVRSQISQAETIRQNFQSLDDNYSTPAVDQLNQAIDYINFLIHNVSNELGQSYGMEFTAKITETLKRIGDVPPITTELPLITSDDSKNPESEPQPQPEPEPNGIVPQAATDQPIKIYTLPTDYDAIMKFTKNEMVEMLREFFTYYGKLKVNDTGVLSLTTPKYDKGIQLPPNCTLQKQYQESAFLIDNYITAYHKDVFGNDIPKPNKGHYAKVVKSLLISADKNKLR